MKPKKMGGLSQFEIMTEDEIGRDIELVDERLLGPEGAKYDSVFSEVRSKDAQARYNHIMRIAKRFKIAGVIAGTILAASVYSALDIPQPEFVGEDSCLGIYGVENGQYLQHISGPVPKNTLSCSLVGQEYLIKNVGQTRH